MPHTAPAEVTHAEFQLNPTDNSSSNMQNNDVLQSPVALKAGYDSDDREDPATQAASEDLKHTSISDKEPRDAVNHSTQSGDNVSVKESREGAEKPEKPATPERPERPELSEAQDEEMRERLSSPKKKRGREQDDEVRDTDAADIIEETGNSPNSNALNGGRTTRSAPEKKRHRDASVDAVVAAEARSDAKDTVVSESGTILVKDASDDKPSTTSPEIPPKPTFGSNVNDKAQTSVSALTSSSFGSLAASSTSGFAALAATKPGVFGGGVAPQLSGFGGLSGASPLIPNTLGAKPSFGGAGMEPSNSKLAGGFGTTTTTGFGALGSGFGGGFRGFTGGSGPKLSSFATSGTPDIVGAEKPTKLFGAPESDEEEDSDDDESKGGAPSDDEESVSVDDKKKHKLSKVPVYDGEEGETTLLQFRAKLYTLVSKEKGWKERGVGVLKLNVPRSYVDYDSNGVPILGSFDPSVREESDEDGGESGPTAARLIMRQENTHRVILNTIILKALKFEQKPSNSSSQILFTAFEDTKPVNMLLKLSDTNAQLFTSEITSIQKEL